MLFVVCVGCCWLIVVRRVLPIVCCSWFVVVCVSCVVASVFCRCGLRVACCVLFGACCLWFVVFLLFGVGVCCLLYVDH